MTKADIEEHELASGPSTKTARVESPSEPGDREATGKAGSPPPLPRRRVFFFVGLLLVCLLGYGGYEHWVTYDRATQTQQEAIDFVPEVRTITAKLEDGPVKLTLPGQTEPFFSSTIYPRATGYVAERRVDIGSHVKKGDLLIRIAAPDLDAQLAQAKGQLEQTVAAQGQANAQLAQSNANLSLAQVTSKRFETLTKQGYQTVQNNDNQSTQVQSQEANVESAKAAIKVADANTQAAQASVQRLDAMVSFERVVAPFDGVITTRGVDIGDLVNADNHTGSPLFTVAADKVLRVTVHVPQANAYAIKDGLLGTAYLPQKPEQTFSGRIARSSIALLNSARTLDTEVDIENPTGALKPGAYVDVTFDIPRERPNVVLPAETIVFNQNGLQVAAVQDDQVRFQTISIYRDFGKTFEVRDGVSGGEQIIMNPPPDLRDGQKVKIRAKPPEEEAKK